MKRLLLGLALTVVASAAFGQQIDLPTPEVSAPLTKWVVSRVEEFSAPNPNSIIIELTKVTAAGVAAACPPASVCSYTATLTVNAEFLAYLTARETAVAGENAGTGLVARESRRQARIAKFVQVGCATFAVNPCPPNISGGTYGAQ